MPYKTPLTFTYDSGRFEENMDRATKLADWNGFAARRKEAAQRGMLRGIGLSNTIEIPRSRPRKFASIRSATLVTGSVSHGQGHATVQTQILADRLGVDPNRVTFVQGDTDAVAFGMGTGGSRLDHHERWRDRHGKRQDHRQGQGPSQSTIWGCCGIATLPAFRLRGCYLSIEFR